MKEEGSIIVFVAVLFSVLLMIAAFVIDVGAIASKKRKLQNVADDAAILCLNAVIQDEELDILEIVVNVLESSGVKVDDCDVEVSYVNGVLRLTIASVNEVYFAKLVLGSESTSTRVQSEAKIVQKQVDTNFAIETVKGITCTDFGGDGINVVGDVYSGAEVIGKLHVDGSVYAGGPVSSQCITTDGVTKLDHTIKVKSFDGIVDTAYRVTNADVDLFNSELSEEEPKLIYYSGSVSGNAETFNSFCESLSTDKLLYFDGDITINMGDSYLSETVIAKGDITVGGCEEGASVDLSCISLDGNVHVSGDNISVNGLLISQDGIVSISGDWVFMQGGMIAKEVLLSGSSMYITKDVNAGTDLTVDCISIIK